MDLLRAAPGLLFIPLVVIIGLGCVFIAPQLVVLVILVLAIRKARRKRRHRFDPFVSRMLE